MTKSDKERTFETIALVFLFYGSIALAIASVLTIIWSDSNTGNKIALTLGFLAGVAFLFSLLIIAAEERRKDEE